MKKNYLSTSFAIGIVSAALLAAPVFAGTQPDEASGRGGKGGGKNLSAVVSQGILDEDTLSAIREYMDNNRPEGLVDYNKGDQNQTPSSMGEGAGRFKIYNDMLEQGILTQEQLDSITAYLSTKFESEMNQGHFDGMFTEGERPEKPEFTEGERPEKPEFTEGERPERPEFTEGANPHLERMTAQMSELLTDGVIDETVYNNMITFVTENMDTYDQAGMGQRKDNKQGDLTSMADTLLAEGIITQDQYNALVNSVKTQ